MNVTQYSESIQVAVRLRPIHPSQHQLGKKKAFTIDQGSLLLNKGLPELQRKYYSCAKQWSCFYKLFDDDTTNSRLFNQTLKQLIPGLFEGVNCCIIVYGQTGSGKTYSMLGNQFGQPMRLIPDHQEELLKHHNEKGLIYNSIQTIFAQLPQSFAVTASYLQIYNDLVYDLLSNQQQLVALPIIQGRKQFFVKGLTKVPIQSLSNALQILKIGESKRKYASTVMNHISSRSHCILRYQVSGISTDFQIQSQINFVDLAGSQRLVTYQNRAHQDRQTQSKYINKSLFFLTQVISQLSTRRSQDDPVSYRNSPLTKLLKNCLGGNSKTRIVVCLNPTTDQFQHSLSSLRFGLNARQVTNKIVKSLEPVTSQKNLLKRIKDLQTRQIEMTFQYQKTIQNLLQNQQNNINHRVLSKMSKRNCLLEKKVELIEQLLTKQQSEQSRLISVIYGESDILQNMDLLPALQQICQNLNVRIQLTKTYKQLSQQKKEGDKMIHIKQQLIVLNQELAKSHKIC